VGLLIDIGVAKTNKYASRESGDTVEVIERPAGGLTIVMADGQGSGRAAKTLSQMAASRAVAAIKDGARDEAAAITVNDHLLAYRHGQVSSSLILLSFDLRSNEATAARFGDGSLIVLDAGDEPQVMVECPPAGRYPGAEPVIRRWPLAPKWLAVACTDGVSNAGSRDACQIDLLSFIRSLRIDEPAQIGADRLLQHALSLAHGKPGDDMSIALARVSEWDGDSAVRRMSVRVETP
jgi:serine phosphatase RsbU (regulator of sigma subunit)